jgi:hypothetical protein
MGHIGVTSSPQSRLKAMRQPPDPTAGRGSGYVGWPCEVTLSSHGPDGLANLGRRVVGGGVRERSAAAANGESGCRIHRSTPPECPRRARPCLTRTGHLPAGGRAGARTRWAGLVGRHGRQQGFASVTERHYLACVVARGRRAYARTRRDSGASPRQRTRGAFEPRTGSLTSSPRPQPDRVLR